MYLGKYKKATKFPKRTLVGAERERIELAASWHCWSAQWKASIGWSTTARGDCVGICNMLMCEEKKMNPIPQESPAYVKYIVSLSQSIYQATECQLNCTGWCRYMVGYWCQSLLQLSFAGAVCSTQQNGRHIKAKLNVLEIMPLKSMKCHSLAEKNVKCNVSS